MSTGQQAVDEALTWLGTPYHHQGHIKGMGVETDIVELLGTDRTSNS